MWLICEKIVLILFVIAIIVLFILSFLIAIKLFIIYPFSNYYLKKKTNSLQWKAVETEESKEVRMNSDFAYTQAFNKVGENILQKGSLGRTFILMYRILPSELPYLVNVFRDNDWKTFKTENPLHFFRKEHFKEYVSNFKTYGDLLKYFQEKENLTIWVEPEN